jgi:hypothetical protein
MTAPDTRYPAAIGDTWPAIKSEVDWLHVRWTLYRQVYGTSAERVDVLNRSASMFFTVLQMSMLDEMQQALCRFGDAAGTGLGPDLSLSGLAARLEAAGETAIAKQLKGLVAAYAASCKQMRKRREKFTERPDRESLKDSKLMPLLGPTRDEFEAALEALRAVTKCVETHYTKSQTVYENFVVSEGGDKLLVALKRGLRYQQLTRERVIPHDDLRKYFI